MSHAKHYWEIYKLFYDPPGTPPEKRCISCRYAAAGGAGTVGLAATYGSARTMSANALKGMGFLFVALLGFGSSLVALRMASMDKEWNETRYLELLEETKAKRQEHKQKMLEEKSQQNVA